jgi:DNA-binding MarR family transcriptional regulator
MNSRDFRALRILEEVENNSSASQRELSKELNISVGLVNSFIQRLAAKGYFKIAHIPKNRVRYILTPKGAAAKTRLTYAYIQSSYQYYRQVRHKLRELFLNFTLEGIKYIVFYGATDFAEIAYLSLLETPIQLAAVVDDLKIGKKFAEMTVEDPCRLDSLKFDKILITAVGSRQLILRKILERGISPEMTAEIT